MLLKYCLPAMVMSCFTLLAHAQPRAFIEGEHYQVLTKPVPTETDADHIEVRDMFWYGCPECFPLEPMLSDWRDGTTGDLVFARMPAVWNDIMALHARLYYTGQALKAEDRMHQAAFRAIHVDNNPLRTEAQIRALFLDNGIESEAFEAAWNSAEVGAAVQQARLRTADYGIEKLPTVVVNGRFRVVLNDKVFNLVELNIAMNMVVRMMREERRSDF